MSAPKLAVISGGTQGLGASLTRAFLERGYEVIAIYRSNDAAAQMFAGEPRVHLFKHDLSTSAPSLPIPAAVEKLVVIHNASSSFTPFSVQSVDSDEMVKLFLTNVLGAKHLLAATVKPLAKTQGTWVSVLTQALKESPKGFSHYLAAKAGLEAWTRAAETELGPKKIRFTCAYPGYMETQLTKDWPEMLRSSQTPTTTHDAAIAIIDSI